MFNGGREVRAYRPSHRALREDVVEVDLEVEKAREANVALYAARVSAGLHLFDGPGTGVNEGRELAL